MLFREAVLGFLGVGEKDNKLEDYCRACKISRGIKVGMPDEKCETCSKDFKVTEEKKKEKTIGRTR